MIGRGPHHHPPSKEENSFGCLSFIDEEEGGGGDVVDRTGYATEPSVYTSTGGFRTRSPKAAPG